MEIQQASVRTQRRRLDETVSRSDAFGIPERLPRPTARHPINRNRVRFQIQSGEEQFAPVGGDVAEGDVVGPMVKGPLTVTDMVCWHVGMGMGLYGVAPLRLGAANRRRVPRFYHRDDQNVPDVMQRVHWDPAFAQRSGNPTTFDYGRMRETWLIHLCTDWMGDDAWLWKLDCEFRRFNFVGNASRASSVLVMLENGLCNRSGRSEPRDCKFVTAWQAPWCGPVPPWV
mgnify:CR=1 FL=1